MDALTETVEKKRGRMNISISNGKTSHDFYNVPPNVAKAVITLLEECGNDETEIITAESEDENEHRNS